MSRNKLFVLCVLMLAGLATGTSVNAHGRPYTRAATMADINYADCFDHKNHAACRGLFQDHLITRNEYCFIITSFGDTDSQFCLTSKRNVRDEVRGGIEDSLEALQEEVDEDAQVEVSLESITSVVSPSIATTPAQPSTVALPMPKSLLHAIAIVHNMDAEAAIVFLDENEVGEIGPGGQSIIWSSQPFNRELVFQRVGKKKMGRVILTVPLPLEPDKGNVETVTLTDGREVTAQSIILTETR